MNPLSSLEFRSRNNVLHHSKIIRNLGWDCPHPGTGDWGHVGHFDVIDLNNDGAAPERDEKWYKTDSGHIKYTLKNTEPSLVNDLFQISKLAKNRHAEVVTQEDAGDLQIENSGVKGTWKSSNCEIIHENRRSISTLVNELEPFEKGTKWAIDFRKDEFLIYRPK